MTVKVGDRIGEYKLAKIFPERITLETPWDNVEVLLYDSKMVKKRICAKMENRPSTVTSSLPITAPTPAGALQPVLPRVGKPGEPIEGQVIEIQMPRPATPAPIPSPRTRTCYRQKLAGED